MATIASARPNSTARPATDWTRNHARASGIFYLLTFASSIAAVVYFLKPVLDNPNYIVGPGQDTRVIIGCLLDVVNALTCIGTAVAVYPVVKRQNRSMALGFVTSRMYEAAVIMVGVICLLAVVALRDATASGTNANTLVTIGHELVAMRDYTFLLGPNLAACVNALLFATLLLKSRLVPRFIPAMGLAAAPLLLAPTIATILGATEHGSIWWAPGGALIFVWELTVGLYMTFKGFKPTALTATPPQS
ncbi:protein of unknown function [Pedococcus cremeus]|uniref:DUF4386 domain-containing protein n=1 Tax=Pedococcus cremeus TaxID=587636 RepID=A0A1H9XSF8_9MICO|nr:DUF4386 domain-containing protein [Pedococcus cremeus]SES48979.1 protein of unknown function [Pedococcus cremeus]